MHVACACALDLRMGTATGETVGVQQRPAGACSLELLYAEPVCGVVKALDDSPRQAAQGVVVLHLLQHGDLSDTPAPSPPPAAAATALALQAFTTAAFSALLTSGQSTGGSTAGREAAGQGTRRLAAMLFSGHTLLYQYSWPLPSPAPHSESKHITAALTLPTMEQPGLLQLVLVEQRLMAPQHRSRSTPHDLLSRWTVLGSSGGFDSTDSSCGAAQGSHRSPPEALGALQLASMAFARVPLLFLPHAAQQEVQQLLLPAMTAEVAAAQQQQQQQQWSAAHGASSAHQPASSIASSQSDPGQLHPSQLLVAAAAWQHWQELADDIGRVFELCQCINAQSLASAPPPSTSSADDGSTHQQQQQQQAPPMPAAAEAMGPHAMEQLGGTSHDAASATMLMHLAQAVLEFLQHQGLNQCCAAVLEQMPPGLAAHWQRQQPDLGQEGQQQEQQQQEEQEQPQQALQGQQEQPQQHPQATLPAEGSGWPVEAALPVQATPAREVPLLTGGTAGAASGAPGRALVGPQQTLQVAAGQQGHGPAATTTRAARPPTGARGSQVWMALHQELQAAHPPAAAASSSSADQASTPAASSSSPHQAFAQAASCSSPHLAAASASAAAGAGNASSSAPAGAGSLEPSAAASLQVTWATSWRMFPPAVEQQYLDNKNQSFIWMDRHIARFVAAYLSALLLRMVWERSIMGTACYFYFIVCKGLPYVQLVRGNIPAFLRHRERNIAVISQCFCMGPILLGALFCDPATQPHLRHALGLFASYSWRLLQPACQVLALPAATAWLLLEPLLQALLGQQLLQLLQLLQHGTGACLGVAGAAGLQLLRAVSWWGFACHSRLCGALQPPASPMRAFWRLRGELLVIGVMPVPQNVRLRYHVPSITMEVAAMIYMFAMVFPFREVVQRFGLALLLSYATAWYWDLSCRRRFLVNMRRQAEERQAALAQKLQQVLEH